MAAVYDTLSELAMPVRLPPGSSKSRRDLPVAKELPRLPLDVLLCVYDQIADDPTVTESQRLATGLACCKVSSRAFLDLGRRLLYTSIKVRMYVDIDREWFGLSPGAWTLARSKSCASYVRSLHIQFEGDYDDELPEYIGECTCQEEQMLAKEVAEAELATPTPASGSTGALSNPAEAHSIAPSPSLESAAPSTAAATGDGAGATSSVNATGAATATPVATISISNVNGIPPVTWSPKPQVQSTLPFLPVPKPGTPSPPKKKVEIPKLCGGDVCCERLFDNVTALRSLTIRTARVSTAHSLVHKFASAPYANQIEALDVRQHDPWPISDDEAASAFCLPSSLCGVTELQLELCRPYVQVGPLFAPSLQRLELKVTDFTPFATLAQRSQKTLEHVSLRAEAAMSLRALTPPLGKGPFPNLRSVLYDSSVSLWPDEENPTGLFDASIATRIAEMLAGCPVATRIEIRLPPQVFWPAWNGSLVLRSAPRSAQELLWSGLQCADAETTLEWLSNTTNAPNLEAYMVSAAMGEDNVARIRELCESRGIRFSTW